MSGSRCAPLLPLVNLIFHVDQHSIGEIEVSALRQKRSIERASHKARSTLRLPPKPGGTRYQKITSIQRLPER